MQFAARSVVCSMSNANHPPAVLYEMRAMRRGSSSRSPSHPLHRSQQNQNKFASIPSFCISRSISIVLAAMSVWIRTLRVRHTLCTDLLREQVSMMRQHLGYAAYDVSILLSDDKKLEAMNRRERGIAKPTDVLSFPFLEALNPGTLEAPPHSDFQNLGDIYISVERAHRDGDAIGSSLSNHLAMLSAHSLCHLLGYDHETDEEFAEMQKVEDELLKLLKDNDLYSNS